MHDAQLPVISDEDFNDLRSRAREYTLVVLKTTAQTFASESLPVVWEHGRRNAALRAAGILSIVCPVTDGGDIAGIGLFSGSIPYVSEIMDGDPAVKAGILTYEIHPARGFPGDCLPAEPA